MNKNMLAVVGVVGVIVALMAVSSYNKLVSLDERINSAWAQVETVLQRRYDLIPNLVNVVKGYATHEKEIFEEVARLRSQWSDAKTTADKAQAASQMEGAIGRLIMVTENYPELKANQNFMALQDELAGTENRISVERRKYNEAVRDYNLVVRRFPTKAFAGLMGFQKSDAYFNADEGAARAPVVQF